MFEKYNEKARRALFFARYEASKLGSRVIESEQIMLGYVREESSTNQKERETDNQNKELPFHAEYARDLTQMAHQAKFDPLIGREKEVERIIQILSRRTKNNPILLGEPGVGKTAIVEGLATRIVEGAVPMFLSSKKILALDLSLIVAGTKYRGQFEERLKGIIRELRENPDLIIFIA